MLWHGRIDATWDFDHCILADTVLYLGYLIPGTWSKLVIVNIGGEEMGKFTHGGINDLLIGIVYLFDPPPTPLPIARRWKI